MSQSLEKKNSSDWWTNTYFLQVSIITSVVQCCQTTDSLPHSSITSRPAGWQGWAGLLLTCTTIQLIQH